MEVTNEEQYGIIKYFYKKGETDIDIHKNLVWFCGSDALDLNTISSFVAKLNDQSSKDDETFRSKIEITIQEYCRASIDFISAKTKIPCERVLEISKNLKKTNIYTCWMPTTFDDHNKLKRIMHCGNMLKYNLEKDFLERMIIVQEIWLPVFNMKKESSLKKECFSLSLKKDCSQFTCESKLSRMIFWDQKSVILDYTFRKDKFYICDYQNILQNYFLPTIAEVRPKLDKSKIILYHDNTMLNKMPFMQNNFESILVPINSPDLFPGDFWFNRSLRLALGQEEYSSMADMNSAIQNWYKKISAKEFEQTYKMMINHWEKCLDGHGESLVQTCGCEVCVDK